MHPEKVLRCILHGVCNHNMFYERRGLYYVRGFGEKGMINIIRFMEECTECRMGLWYWFYSIIHEIKRERN